MRRSAQWILAAVLWAWIPFFWQPLRGQAPGVGVDAVHKQKHQTSLAEGNSTPEQRGAKDKSLPWCIEIFMKPEWVTVFVTAGYVLIAGWTLITIRRQADLMKRQADSMDQQAADARKSSEDAAAIANGTLRAIERQVELTEPHFYVDYVRAYLEDGQRPIFFVKIMNSGIIAAEGVAVSITVEIDQGISLQTPGDQVMSIRANGGREYFIRSGMVLDKDRLLKYTNGTTQLRVHGHIKWKKKTVEYCYKYYPWPSGKRPKHLPDFVPCDLEDGVNTKLKSLTGTATFSGFAPALDIKTEDCSEETPKNADKPT